MSQTSFKLSFAAALVVSLAACGGGGSGGNFPSSPASGGSSDSGGGTVTAPVTGAQKATLSGIAATGAAFSGATINVVDQSGKTVCSTISDEKGAYSCDLPEGTKAPLVITAQRDDVTLYSTTASAGGGVANVTPLTTIIVSRLSPDGNPASLAGAIQTNPSSVSDATVKQQVAALVEALKPLLSALGDTLDPISGTFSADGTGHDGVLDAINVSVRPDGTAANIEITVKTIPTTDGSAPVSISFRSDATIPATLPAITSGQLVPASTVQLVAGFFERFNACFALPVTQRVSTATNDSTNAIGTAADVAAQICKSLFIDSDPSKYYTNGLRVGRDASNAGAFAGLFRAGATGVKFDRPNLEYVTANGDAVVSYRTVDTAGTVTYDTITLRKTDGVLQTPGNGNDFNVLVAPWVQTREYLNAPGFSYHSTAYSINITKTANVAKVLVTTPFDRVLDFGVNPGTPYMTIKVNGVPSGTPNLRLATAWTDIAKAGNPMDKLSQGLVVTNPQLTDDQIRALPDQSVWKLEFFDAGGNSLGIQNHRTLSRAVTMAELRQIKMADFTPALRDEIKSGSTAGYIQMDSAPDNIVDLSAEGEKDGWTVPAGAVAPGTVTVMGGGGFQDSINVSQSTRKVIVPCSSDNANDQHCDMSVPTAYRAGTRLTAFELVARAPRMVTINKALNLEIIQ